MQNSPQLTQQQGPAKGPAIDQAPPQQNDAAAQAAQIVKNGKPEEIQAAQSGQMGPDVQKAIVPLLQQGGPAPASPGKAPSKAPSKAAPADAAPAAAAAAAAPVKTEFDVVMTAFGEKKLDVVKVVKNLTGQSLMDAKKLVEAPPATIKAGVSEDEAKKVKAELEAAGATVELK